MPPYDLAAQLAEAMGELWAALDIERRDYWLKLTDVVEQIYDESDEAYW